MKYDYLKFFTSAHLALAMYIFLLSKLFGRKFTMRKNSSFSGISNSTFMDILVINMGKCIFVIST